MNHNVRGAMISLGSVFAFIFFLVLMSRFTNQSFYREPRTIDQDFRTDLIQSRV